MNRYVQTRIKAKRGWQESVGDVREEKMVYGLRQYPRSTQYMAKVGELGTDLGGNGTQL